MCWMCWMHYCFCLETLNHVQETLHKHSELCIVFHIVKLNGVWSCQLVSITSRRISWMCGVFQKCKYPPTTYIRFSKSQSTPFASIAKAGTVVRNAYKIVEMWKLRKTNYRHRLVTPAMSSSDACGCSKSLIICAQGTQGSRKNHARLKITDIQVVKSQEVGDLSVPLWFNIPRAMPSSMRAQG